MQASFSVVHVLERYFEGLRNHDWEGLSDCLAERVERCGPYLDVVRGREAYVSFLREVLPKLPNHRIEVSGLHSTAEGATWVELSETLDVAGRPTTFPEVIRFDLDGAGRIARVDIYIKQPPGTGAVR